MVSKVFKNMEDLLDKKIFAKNNLKTAYRKLEIDIETKNQQIDELRSEIQSRDELREQELARIRNELLEGFQTQLSKKDEKITELENICEQKTEDNEWLKRTSMKSEKEA